MKIVNFLSLRNLLQNVSYDMQCGKQVAKQVLEQLFLSRQHYLNIKLIYYLLSFKMPKMTAYEWHTKVNKNH